MRLKRGNERGDEIEKGMREGMRLKRGNERGDEIEKRE